MEAQQQRLQSLFGPRTHIGSPLGTDAPLRRGEPLQRRTTSETATRAEPQPEAIATAPAGAAPNAAPRPNVSGLPDALKGGVESLSGLSLDGVKVHYNSAQPAQLNALAYAQGHDIHLAPGQEKLLPHETWHVVQQAQGRVHPTLHHTGTVPINDDAALEKEADVMGARANASSAQLMAAWQAPPSNLQTPPPISQTATTVVQRIVVDSYWLRFDRTAREQTLAETPEKEASKVKKKEMHNQPRISIATSPTSGFTLCEDSTDSSYRNSAEERLGSLGPLALLAMWGAISPKAQFMKAHLIGAEFGGQQKYRPADNIRFHPRDLEQGEWQGAENAVKNGGHRGILTVRSTESDSASQLVRELLAVIASDVSFETFINLRGKLQKLLVAANYVPESVEFIYQDFEGGENVHQSWKDQATSLAVIGKQKEIYGALQALGVIEDLKIAIPEQIRTEVSTPEVEINSKQRLYDLLLEHCKDKKAGRRKDVLNHILNFRKSSRAGDEAFAAHIKKLPELKSANLVVKVTGDFRTW
jgi:hypothetical protein